MSIRVAIALRIFHILMAEDGTLISAAELAKKAGAELLLISKLDTYVPESIIVLVLICLSTYHASSYRRRICR